MTLGPSQLIVLATPAFLLLIALEIAWGLARGRNTYRLADAVSSMSAGMLSEITKVFTRVLRVGIYTAAYAHVALVPLEAARAFWSTWYGWLLALLCYDFCYYWLHRAGHEIAIFWAAHVVHHQSQDYNLSTALRQTSSGALLGWVFALPLALAGVPPLVFGAVALIDLLYQFWVHTEHVGKLGWFDRWFCSPSNHRVHHAVNDRYLDRNYGGVLIVWDRLFGSFRQEDERCVYGTRHPLNSLDPLWSNLEVYCALARDAWHTGRWGDKLRVWIKPPGWRPADVAARFPRPPFDLSAVRRFDPPVTRPMAWFAAVQFVLLLAAVLAFLWRADTLALPQDAVWVAALTAGLWGVSATLQGRITWLELLLIEAAALATATSALGWVEWHRWFKPLALLLAIAMVAGRARRSTGWRGGQALLLAGLACSLAGDCFLMLNGFFIHGLAAFLAAQLCYLALFKRGLPWFPSGKALLATLAVGIAMYAVLFERLGPVLKLAVAAYAIVISLMAAQAIGRAAVRRDRASLAVAVGSGFFMLSDALLAINKFALPLPLAPLWVLATYYAAQFLIARFALEGSAGAQESVAPGATIEVPQAG
ncbi:lysoplasmalogenase family protein [Ramlibacter sp.]|uniref:lysoplasmalogenase family protein n=1 Tax=Ramlibacter sp. TaxID=1917967 RepID=UPI002B76636C|nr:lysoplasmalogenase family protein [Ramlibacter sp.]HWI82395.1 lysoplasmalogenase family protein [Ramlibacter sp.]